MTVAIHGYPVFKYFLPATNTLAVGAKLFTYEVGTTTKKTAYKDFDKNTSHTNPIILDANGEVPTALWLDGKYKLVLAPSNDTDPPASPYWTIDDVGDEDLTASVAGVSNKIPNGSFEIDTSGDGVPDNWSLTAGTGNTLVIDTASQIHGDTSLKFTITSANTADAITDFFEVQEGVQEILRFSLKASAVDANIIVRLKWYTDAQVFVSNTDVYSDSAANPTSWTDKGYLYTPPSTARFAKLQILVATTGKTVNIDNFRTAPIDDHDIPRTVTGEWIIGGVSASNLLDKSAAEVVSGQWGFTASVKGLGGNWLISPDGEDITPAHGLVLNRNSSGAIYTQYVNNDTGVASTNGFLVGITASEEAWIYNIHNSDMVFLTNDKEEMRLPSAGRGLILGIPAGLGKGNGTVNAANGFYDDGVRIKRTVNDEYTTSGTTASIAGGAQVGATITHGLGTDDVMVDIQAKIDNATYDGRWMVMASIPSGTTNNPYNISILGSDAASGANFPPASIIHNPSTGTISLTFDNVGTVSATCSYRVRVYKRSV